MAYGANYFVQFILPRCAHGFLLTSDLPGLKCRAGYQKAKRCVCPRYVTGKLVANKLTVGQIAIKCRNHPVAIMPCIWPFDVGFKAYGFGPSNDIQPMLRPALSVARGGLQSIDILRESNLCIPGVLDESLHFLRTGRQAGEIECHAAEQGDPVRFG